MVDKLQLRLLGSFQVRDKSEASLSLRRKNRAILAYLALLSQPIGRLKLANLFCQSAADPGHTLRLSLSRLRRKLGAEALIYEGETVQFNPDHFQTDFSLFQSQLGRHEWRGVSVEILEQVVQLYRGEFLDGLHLPDAPEFEIWLVGQRSYWRQLYERGALALLKRLTAESPPTPSALPTAQRLVQHNPLLEEAHYYLIYLYAQTGQRAAALEQFDHCRAILQEELAVEPTANLLSLYHDIQAGRLLQTHPTTPPPADISVTSAVDFVGREVERQQMNAIWDKVQEGTRRALLITAEAGGGKTRLLQEWASALPQDHFLYSPCYETTRTLPYHPWQTVLKQLYTRLDPAVLENLDPFSLNVLSRLIPALARRHTPITLGHQDQLFSAVHNFLRLIDKPLVLCFDDLQWADAATLKLLHFLAVQRIPPLLFIGAYRTEEADENTALLTLLRDWARNPEEIISLSLAPLTAESVAQLMERLWPQLPEGYRDPHLRDRLIQATGGNPLFVSEIIRELAGSRQLPQTLPVPPSLRELIQRRLQELPASGRQVLESLAILNQPAEFDLARQISGRSEEETLTALEIGLRRRLLVSTKEIPALIDFSHDLMGQAVREQLTPVRKQLLHRRTANSLAASGGKAATLAYHFAEAGDSANEARYARRAGEAAAILYANDEAIYFFEQALAVDPTPATWLQLGDVRRRIGRWDEAEAAYQHSLALAQSGNEEAVAQLALGKLEIGRGNYAAGKHCLETAEPLFRQLNNQEQLAESYNNLAIIAYFQTDYVTALDYYQKAFEIDEILSDTEGMVKRLGNIGLVYLQQGQLDQAQSLLEQSLQLARQIKDQELIANRLSNLGIVASKKGESDRALALYEQSVVIDETLGHSESVARTTGNMGVEYYYMGAFSQALSSWEKALAMEWAMGNIRGQALWLGNIGEARQDFGDFDQAEKYLAQALQMDLNAEHWDAVARHIGNLAQSFQRQAKWLEAKKWVEPALTLTRRLGANGLLAENLYTAAQIAFQEAEWQKAETCLQECLPLAQNKSDKPIFLPGTILLLQTRRHQQKLTAAATNEQLQSLLPAYPTPADQAALHDAIWQTDPTRSDARQKAAEQYQTAHQKFPHILYRQRYTALTGATLPPPTISIETADIPPPPSLDHLYTQLIASLSKKNNPPQHLSIATY